MRPDPFESAWAEVEQRLRVTPELESSHRSFHETWRSKTSGSRALLSDDGRETLMMRYESAPTRSRTACSSRDSQRG